ncbi:hypothetical protein H4R20_002166 [Coemansia guatemalensis]|uniref:Protein kinase domain-containing protein n=1 Tax=Coemansia guatemalensis TaxID=2761395 RepID=A0A9W8I4D0_9FUNG|nr:hypothetical protein H4R20_002166 [Coemansia guatemalensis]
MELVDEQQTDMASSEQNARLNALVAALNTNQYERLLAFVGGMSAEPHNLPLAMDANNNDVKGSTLQTQDSTPARRRRSMHIVERSAYVSDSVREQRRDRIATEIEERIEYVALGEINSLLNLDDRYSLFDGYSQGLFEDIARFAPTMDSNGLRYSPGAAGENFFADLYCQDGSSKKQKEQALTDYFQHVWQHLCKPKEQWPQVAQVSELTLHDFQTRKVQRTAQQPDGLFCVGSVGSFKAATVVFEAKWTENGDDISHGTLGQIGDYVLNIWHSQFARSYVPVILLHGGEITLMVFTRRNVLVANVGPICGGAGMQNLGPPSIAATLRDLWFYLSLPSDKLGNPCKMMPAVKSLRLVPGTAGDPGRIEDARRGGDGAIHLGERIGRPVRIVRRATYMHKCKYSNAGTIRKAILKLTWSPKYRLPEGAAYQIIKSACGGLIPEVYSSGVLVPDSFGYRLEYAVIEDCGETLEEYAKNFHESKDIGAAAFSAKMAEVVRSVSNCLAKAYSAGVLHRDISPGNIAINRNGTIKLIDWGCARLRADMTIPNLDAIARRWSYTLDDDAHSELRHDSLTGTHPSMSIQVLGGCTKRSLLHDLESVFFTVLYALAAFEEAIGDKNENRPLGFSYLGHKETAALRVGCLASSKYYCKRFGVTACSGNIKDVLDAMYYALYYQNGQYIGGDLIENSDWDRPIRPSQVSGFMDSDLFLEALTLNPEHVDNDDQGSEICDSMLERMDIESVDGKAIEHCESPKPTKRRVAGAKHWKQISPPLATNVDEGRKPRQSQRTRRAQPVAEVEQASQTQSNSGSTQPLRSNRFRGLSRGPNTRSQSKASKRHKPY